MPIFWSPITLYLGLRSLLQFGGYGLPPFFTNPLLPISLIFNGTLGPDVFLNAFLCFLLGCIIWTILEYTLHRFLFHIDSLLPDRPEFLTLHFLLHGIHHYMPMDRFASLPLNIEVAYLSVPKTSPRHAANPFYDIASPVYQRSAHGLARLGCKCGYRWRFYFLYDVVSLSIWTDSHVITDMLYDCMHYGYVYSFLSISDLGLYQ